MKILQPIVECMRRHAEILYELPYNMNKPREKGLTGTGNMNLVIRKSKGNKAAFNLWLIDSGRYAPATNSRTRF